VVRSNKVARKRLTESNGTPAMDLGHMNVLSSECICILVCIEDMRFCIVVINLHADIEYRNCILFVVLSSFLCLVFLCFVC